MFRVITRNSEYNVTAEGNGFYVSRAADRWGRQVKDAHGHFTRYLSIEVGGALKTDVYSSASSIEAVLERDK